MDLYRDKSRISARKSYRICPMCRGKGYFDDSSIFTSKPSLHNTGISTGGVDHDRRDVFGKGDEYDMRSSQCGDISLAASVPQLPVLRSKGDSERVSHLKDKRSISTVLPDKMKSLHPRRSFERGINLPRKSMSRIRSFGSETSVNSDSSDLLDVDRDLGNPKEALKHAKTKIKSYNWESIMSGLEDLAVLGAQFPDLNKSNSDFLETNNSNASCPNNGLLDWDIVGTAMTKLVASFHVQKTRSVRLTCQILKEMFKLMNSSVHRPQFDDAVNELIKRTADTSRMVRWDAHQALDSMIKHVPPQFSTRAILSQAPKHKNAVVRQTAMRLVHATVEALTPHMLLSQTHLREPRKQIINSLCSLVDDQNQHVRWLVRQTIQMLMQEESFEEILNGDVEPHILKKADRSLVLLQYNTDLS